MSELKRIGLFCGCFDPVHSGHITAAEIFRSAAELDRVYLIPANGSYSKYGARMESGLHRLHMCRLAAEGHAGIEVSDFEINAQGVPYTIDTVLFFKQRFPASGLYLCMGEDTARTVIRWACFDELKELVTFLVINREDHQVDTGSIVDSGGTAVFVSHDRDGISSTEIRKRLRSGAQDCQALDEKVLHYIREHALYGTGTLKKQEGDVSS